MSHMLDSGIIPQLEAWYGPMFFFTTESGATYRVDFFNNVLTFVDYPHDMSKSTKALKILGIQQLEVKKSSVFFAVADEGDVDVTIRSTAPILTIERHEFDL